MTLNELFDELKLKVTNSDFEKYLKQLVYVDKYSHQELAVFEVPNKFIASYIQSKFSHIIHNIFKTKAGIEPVIEIRVATNEVVNDNSREITSPATTEVQETPTKRNENTTKLNPLFTFKNFVVGPSNEMAYKVSESVSKGLGKQYNPLFIYGDTGLGKTHLLQAIGNEAIKNNKIVIYVTSEQFMNTFLNSIKRGSMEYFRDTYRRCDILLIDDVQFFSGKESTQEEFFHTFNELNEDNKQIIMTADRVPSKIAGIEERLKSRFLSGLNTQIEIPKLQTKINIIKKKCELNGIVIEDEIIHFIATNFNNSIREIEGVLVNVNAHSTFLHKKIDLELVKSILEDQLFQKEKEITITKIIDLVANELNVKPSDIKTKRTAKATNAKRVIIYLAKKLVSNTSLEIANQLGMKSHSTISKVMSKVYELIETDENFRLLLENLEVKLKSFGD